MGPLVLLPPCNPAWEALATARQQDRTDDEEQHGEATWNDDHIRNELMKT